MPTNKKIMSFLPLIKLAIARGTRLNQQNWKKNLYDSLQDSCQNKIFSFSVIKEDKKARQERDREREKEREEKGRSTR